MAAHTLSSPSTKEKSNYARLCRLLVEVGSGVLRNIFDRVCPPGSLHTVLVDPSNQAKLQTLRKKRVLSTFQWCKLFPAVKSSVSSKDFDSSLLLLLLKNIFGLTFPASGWNCLPPVTDTSPEADIIRIMFFRKIVYSHATCASVDDLSFSLYWNYIKETFLLMEGSPIKDAIDGMKTDHMDPDFEEHYREVFREWLKEDGCITDESSTDETVEKASKEEDMESSIGFSGQKLGMEEMMLIQVENRLAGNRNASPPEVSVTLPQISDLPKTSSAWSKVELPVDILLLTVEDCEFLSCFAFLKEPFKSYHISTGYVYFGCMGDDQGMKMKIALMRCSKGFDVPGGFSAARVAISLLRPKAVISVGACSGLNRREVKLGDVVVSSKLITATQTIPPSRNISNLIKHVADGWKAPLQNADEYNAKVHCDGVFLSIQEGNKYIIGQYPEAIAVDVEGGGVFAAAHDFKTEWLIVKGVKDFAIDEQSSSEKWKIIACVMAASVVANILSHPVTLQDWPHSNAAGSAYAAALKSSILGQTEFQPLLLASRGISNAKTDEIWVNLLIQHGRKALIRSDKTNIRSGELEYYGKVSGTPVKHCSEIFLGMSDDHENPNSILVIGKSGIGKSLFCQKLIRDWAKGNTGISNLEFAFLLTFRRLNLLESNLVTLREILNFSSVLDDNSNMDDFTFHYIVKHPKETMIILDGYDDSSQQDYIAGNLEEKYPNNSGCRMPVAALCSKLIKGKILKGASVMVTSRPDESNKLGGNHFKRYLEIAGFSSEQIKEYIVKYFKKNEKMRNAVLNHVMKNENLVYFAHIPILCFLLCFEMEYALVESGNPHDLPVSATAIYTTLIDIFEHKLNVESEYRQKETPEQLKSPVVKNTLEKLSKLAGKLLVERKQEFDESELEGDFDLEEVTKLKGLLLWDHPPFRTALITTTKHLSFMHLSLQEFLAAFWFVKENYIPHEESSEMVFQFMAGIMAREGKQKLMENVLSSIEAENDRSHLLMVKCLSEYQDKEFAKKFIRNHPQTLCDSDGELSFCGLSDVDSIALSFVLDIISELNKEEVGEAQHKSCEKSVVVKRLAIFDSLLTLSGIQRVCISLDNEHCPVSELTFSQCNLAKDWVDIIYRLVSCKLTTFTVIEIADTGVDSLREALQHPSCRLTTLNLRGSDINDTRVASLCKALQHPSCKLTTLNLEDNEITDTGVASLCEALQHPSCKLTTLNLRDNEITDTGVASLREAVLHPSCKLTTLNLGGNEITDTGVTSLREALEDLSCEITIPDMV